ncbi:cobalamin B12-binding domain-containing protein [Acuticoccus sp. MNP-M23]|uniref:cobalamin B12-binding domain-containing protein n=1 Tax=Acuticoccus sp. MNP-M23 TaxID=3072793 RepID=UPI0028157788|nr:cobalamin B12-binding domain-containing protein [Acuticoccus sp. MNP-M23]WMS42698.1 cobalamin B12-binding domain-containing protein [Acuticoccus sp. MNP-M23]
MPLDFSGETTAGTDGAAPSEAWRGEFARTIENHIVPQLLTLSGNAAAAVPRPTADVVAAVADAAVDSDRETINSWVIDYIDSGGSYADALLHLIAPAARKLGEDWNVDKRDILDVSAGMLCLHAVVSAISARFFTIAMPDRRILLGPTPGETHVFGLAIVEHLFRMAQWEVDYRPTADGENLIKAVKGQWFGLIGLSLSGDTLVEEAARVVRAVRDRSLNRNLKVLVGGPAFLRRRELSTYIGADAVAIDGPDAVKIANRWIADGVVGRAT